MTYNSDLAYLHPISTPAGFLEENPQADLALLKKRNLR